MIFSSLLATIKANHSALTIPHSSNIITSETFLAQSNQKFSEDFSNAPNRSGNDVGRNVFE